MCDCYIAGTTQAYHTVVRVCVIFTMKHFPLLSDFRLYDHVSDKTKLPILIFPEGSYQLSRL